MDASSDTSTEFGDPTNEILSGSDFPAGNDCLFSTSNLENTSKVESPFKTTGEHSSPIKEDNIGDIQPKLQQVTSVSNSIISKGILKPATRNTFTGDPSSFSILEDLNNRNTFLNSSNISLNCSNNSVFNIISADSNDNSLRARIMRSNTDPEYYHHPGSMTPGGNLENGTHSTLTKSYSQNDALLRTPINVFPTVKISGNNGYDWATTEGADVKLCLYLKEKFTSSRDDLTMNPSFGCSGIAMNFGRSLDKPSSLSCRDSEIKSTPDSKDRLQASHGYADIQNVDIGLANNINHVRGNRTKLKTVFDCDLAFLNDGCMPSIIPEISFQSAPINFNGLPNIQRSPSDTETDLDDLIRGRQQLNLDKSLRKFRRKSLNFKAIKMRQIGNNKGCSNSINDMDLQSLKNDESLSSADEIIQRHLDTSNVSSDLLSPGIESKYSTSSTYRIKKRTLNQRRSSNSQQHNLSTHSMVTNSSHDNSSHDPLDCDHLMNISANSNISNEVVGLTNCINDSSMDHMNMSNDSIIALNVTSSINDIHGGLAVDIRDLDDQSPTMNYLTTVYEFNELTFQVNLIGGTYQSCFQDNYPVIAPPSNTDPRINFVKSKHDNNGLELKVYIPSKKLHQSIHLPSTWTWMKANPVGVVLFADRPSPNVHAVGYFLLKHPNDWWEINHKAHMKRNSLQSSSLPSISNRQSQTDHAERLITNAGFVSPILNESFPSKSYIFNSDAVPETIDDYIVMSDMPQTNLRSSDASFVTAWSGSGGKQNSTGRRASACRVSSAMLGSCPELYDDFERNAENNVKCADWNNLGVISFVLEFLMDFNVSSSINNTSFQAQPTATSKASSTSGRSNRRNISTNSLQFSSLRLESSGKSVDPWFLVSKVWALASYRQVAKFKSNPTNILMFSSNQWTNFLSKFNYGKYLSEGACKKVYCIQDLTLPANIDSSQSDSSRGKYRIALITTTLVADFYYFN